MNLRKRSYIIEMTVSGMVPAIVKPLGLVRRAEPGALLTRMMPKRKRKKRYVKRLSKRFSLLPPKI